MLEWVPPAGRLPVRLSDVCPKLQVSTRLRGTVLPSKVPAQSQQDIR